MSQQISDIIGGALSGRKRKPYTHGVRGSSRRNEAIDLRHYRSFREAQDYADEINESGGHATAYRL